GGTVTPPQGVWVDFVRKIPDVARAEVVEPQHPDAIAWAAMSSEQQQTVTRIFINCCKAIAAYQRLLVSADSPFDRFAAAVRTDSLADWAAKGNPGFGEPELAGLDLFTGGADCLACHAGPLFSDFAFHSIRVAPVSGGSPTDAARFEGVNALFQSEFNSAGPHSDDPAAPIARRLEFLANPSTNWGRFKTPSLRNVTLTAPYMHAGQFDTLGRVLDHYSTFENALPPDHHTVQEGLLRPLQLTEAQRQNLVAFLHALTDISIDPRLLEQPNSPLPPSGKAKTGPEADG
ncbi:MAG: cytochrome-c peroxidase, partial [Phycisphaerales bacterium]